MSWAASGTVNSENLDNLPAVADNVVLADGPQKQLDFLQEFLREAFKEGILEGAYSVSLYGHYPVTENDSPRKTLGFSLSPITLEVESTSES